MPNPDTPSPTVADSERAGYPTDELAQICGEVAAAFRRAWGRGPATTAAHWASPNMLVVMLGGGHTNAERTLRAAGHVSEVLEGRRLLQLIVEPELTAAIERILGRAVETTVSGTRLDPDLCVEIFLLTP